MKKLLILPLLLLITTAQTGAETENPEKSLFNGQNLDGWNGDPRLWRVENGILIGETDSSERKIDRNSFLILEKETPANFELSLEVRITGDNNSGIQYRSRTVPGETFLVRGYQMDIHPHPEYNGMLYEEGGRGILALRGEKVQISPNGDKTTEKFLPSLPQINLGEWNVYKIIASAETVTHWINGERATEITDRESGKFSRSGIIALQLHAGPPMKAEFRKIRLKKLPDTTEAGKADQSATPGELPKWIWSRHNPRNGEEIFLRKQFSISEKIHRATAFVTADDRFELSLNGNPVGKGNHWQSPEVFDLTQTLSAQNDHLISVRAQNEGGPAGFVFNLEILLENGQKQSLLSDETWEWSESASPGSTWQNAIPIGTMGDPPWGGLFSDLTEASPQTARDVTAEYQLPPGFKMEQLHRLHKSEGSWVALTIDNKGRLIASDQYGGLFRITPAEIGNPSAQTSVEPLPIPIEGAQGLLWTENALFASTAIGQMGVYKITDSNGDGEYDKVRLIQPLAGVGEHGPHGFALSPDGKWIYFTAGNHTAPPVYDRSFPTEVWDEDQLLPRRPDARGHARDVMAPGGWIARFTPDGKNWELVSIGFRNTYGLAFDQYGELFTWDSDMEWDFGTPWYRPTRINHVTFGSEFGWRHGTGKWPDYYEDSLPGILDIGPGSPTGVISGSGLAFPERYQRALFMLDWTYATIYAVHLTPNGAGYRAETEEFLSGTGLPLTDALAGADGALYFTIGGRRTSSALFRIIYTGNESTNPVTQPKPVDPETSRLTALRHRLEDWQLNPEPAQTGLILESLSSEDRFLRFAARTALEHLPTENWIALLNSNSSPWQTIQMAIAIARTGAKSDQPAAIDALLDLPWENLSEHQKINCLRALGLSFARHGEPDPSRRNRLLSKLEPLFPAETDFLNRELVRMLVYLKSPQVLQKTLHLMARETDPKPPPWTRLASRNEEYGSILRAMMENMPSEQNLFYAYCLRMLDGPWTHGQREQFFSWLTEAAEKSGGASYAGFIADIRNETLKRATPEERLLVESRNPAKRQNPFENLPSVEGPGRAWTIPDALAAAEKGLVNRNLHRGKQMFKATLCAACHQFAGEGGSIGPDLTTIGRRFSITDLITKIIDPNRQVSDQYAFELITLTDGSTWNGRIIANEEGKLRVATNRFDPADIRELPLSEVASVEPSPHSPMPPGLINRLNEEELRDLLAFLLRVQE